MHSAETGQADACEPLTQKQTAPEHAEIVWYKQPISIRQRNSVSTDLSQRLHMYTGLFGHRARAFRHICSSVSAAIAWQ